MNKEGVLILILIRQILEIMIIRQVFIIQLLIVILLKLGELADQSVIQL